MNRKIIQTFRKLGREKRSGVLTCESSQLTRRIFFDHGGIVGVRSTSDAQRLGEVLVQQGHITEQHLTDASIFTRKGKRLGTCLVELHLIKEEDIESFVRLQILEVGSSVVIQPPERLVFAKLKDTNGDITEPMHVLDIVMESARRTPKIESHIQSLSTDDRLLSLTASSMRLMDTVSLKPEEAFILSRVSGSEPTRSVFSLSPLSEEQTARAVLGHLCVGILEFKENPNVNGLTLKN